MLISANCRTQREQGRERSGSGNQRKNDRYKGGIFGRFGLVFKYFDIQNQLESDNENNQRTGNGERGQVNAEQEQKGFSAVKEDNKDNQSQKCGFFGVDRFAAFAEIDENRD